MRIVIDVRRLRDYGIGTYIRSLIQALAAADHENDYVLAALAEDSRMLAELPNNFATAVYRGTDREWLDHLAFPLLVRRFAPELVHIPLNRVPMGMTAPYVVTVHDVGSLLFDERGSVRANLRRYRLRRGLRRAKVVIAVSEATRRDVERLLGIGPEHVRVVYNAPSPEFFTHNYKEQRESEEPERRRILERYQIDYPFLLYAGNIRPQKNIPRLVEAFAVVRANLAGHPVYHDLRLIIIGDEISRFPSVRRAVIQSRVEQAVRFLGFVPQETLRCFYQTAAAFVFPSLYEGFGLPPLEAMACGTPVVTSNVSSLPEVVNDAAMLVNPENVFDIARGVREVLLDEERRGELIHKGRQQAARYSWERTAKEVLEIYKEVAEGRGKRHEAKQKARDGV